MPSSFFHCLHPLTEGIVLALVWCADAVIQVGHRDPKDLSYSAGPYPQGEPTARITCPIPAIISGCSRIQIAICGLRRRTSTFPGEGCGGGGVTGDRGYIKNVELEQVCHARHGRGEEDRPSLIILYVRPES